MFRIIFVIVILGLIGSRMSSVNVEACSAGELSCGTAIWLLLMIAFFIVVAVIGIMKLAEPPKRDRDDA